MQHPRRNHLTSALLVLAVGLLASCGVRAGDVPETSARPDTTTTSRRSIDDPPDDEETTTTAARSAMEQTQVDAMVDLYVGLGLDPDDATCVAEHLVEVMSQPDVDIDDMNRLVGQCDIPLEDLAAVQEQVGGDSPEDAMVNGLATGLESQGLTEDDARCVAEHFVDEYGVDFKAGQDPAKMGPIFGECDISSGDITLPGD